MQNKILKFKTKLNILIYQYEYKIQSDRDPIVSVDWSA